MYLEINKNAKKGNGVFIKTFEYYTVPIYLQYTIVGTILPVKKI